MDLIQNDNLYVSATCTYTGINSHQGQSYQATGRIMMRAQAVGPPINPPQGWFDGGKWWVEGGILVALFDPDNFSTLFSQVYYLTHPFTPALLREYHLPLSPNVFDIYNNIMSNLNAVLPQIPHYLAAVTVFGMPLWGPPTSDCLNWLQSCGATVTQWQTDQGTGVTQPICNYVLIGESGSLPGTQTERFDMLVDAQGNPGNLNTQATYQLQGRDSEDSGKT